MAPPANDTVVAHAAINSPTHRASSPTRIKPGYWNENEENISQITQEELGDWDVIRYLNTWESPGSISLAVRPQSLAAVQGIRLPVQALSSGAAPSLVRGIARIRDHISQIEATRHDEPDQMERFSQRMAARHGASLPREPTPEQQGLDASISKLIEDEYLPGISLPVREKFSNAMLAWRQSQEMEPDDISFIERFALMATALTRPGTSTRLSMPRSPGCSSRAMARPQRSSREIRCCG